MPTIDKRYGQAVAPSWVDAARPSRAAFIPKRLNCHGRSLHGAAITSRPAAPSRVVTTGPSAALRSAAPLRSTGDPQGPGRRGELGEAMPATRARGRTPSTGRAFGRAVLGALLALAVASAAAAQISTGSVRGFVRDGSRAVLPGVTVEVSGPTLINGTTSAISDTQGLYRVDNLPVGIYTVTFTMTGFKTVRHEGIRVEAGRTIEMEQQLEIGALQETVTVSGAAPVVDATHAGTSTNLNQETLANIPTSAQPVLRRRRRCRRRHSTSGNIGRQLRSTCSVGHQPERDPVRRDRHVVAELRRLLRLAELRHDVRAADEVGRRLGGAEPGSRAASSTWC